LAPVLHVDAVGHAYKKMCFLRLTLPHSVQARRYSVSAFQRSYAAASVGSGGDTKAPAPAGSSTTRIFFVQRQGAKSYAALPARGDMLVSLLVKEIKNLLRISAPLDCIALQLASADGSLFRHAKDATGIEQPVMLDRDDTIDEALKRAAEPAGHTIGDADKLCIVVHVAAPAATTALAAAAATTFREFVGSCGSV